MSESFDLIVIGAGQAGPFLAATMAEQGWRAALVESHHLGGTCVNHGCTPTKTLRKSARVAYLARRAAEFGVQTGHVVVDFPAAMDRMQQRVDQSRAGLQSWLGDTAGLTLIQGHGQFAGRDGADILVRADERVLRAPRVVLNTGTRPTIPPIEGLQHVPYFDNESLLALRTLPRHLFIIGGSYIGLEMGQIFSRLGSNVTIIEHGPRIATSEDHDISNAVLHALRAEGIAILTGRAVRSVSVSRGGSIQAVLDDGTSLEGSHLLIATGRTPNTDQLGLEAIDLRVDGKGFIMTNEFLETVITGVWAVGDINRRGAFTHTSYHDHEIVAHNWMHGRPRRSADDRIMTYAMFTDPPLGHVGLYERDARRLVAAGRRISQAVIDMHQVSRAKEESETIGLMKLLIDEESGAFLGASLFGIGADEIVQVIGHIMAAGGTWRTACEVLPVHPTVTEFFPTIIARRQPLTSDLDDRSLPRLPDVTQESFVP